MVEEFEMKEKYDCHLSDLRPGQEGLITGLLGTSKAQRRLMELGFIEGGLVRVLAGSDPMLVLLGESRLGLSRQLVLGVEVLCLVSLPEKALETSGDKAVSLFSKANAA